MEIIKDAIENVSVIGSSPLIFVIAFICILYLSYIKDFLRTFSVVISLFSGVYSVLLKGFFEQGRPAGYVPEGFIPWVKIFSSDVYSFPSTHTVIYTVFFGYLFYLSYKIKGLDNVLRHVFRLFAALMVVFIGSSRVMLEAHYVKDVVFGYIFGLLYLGVLIGVERFLEQKRSHKQPRHTKL